jgi:hypothetical protein
MQNTPCTPNIGAIKLAHDLDFFPLKAVSEADAFAFAS